MDFASDNVFGVHERIMNALVAANAGTSPSYGVDPWTREAEQRLSELFERPVTSFLLMTGTAANALALSQLVPPYGAVFAHADAHDAPRADVQALARLIHVDRATRQI